MNITLPPALERIVKEKVNSGFYANETELVCEALRHEFGRDTVSEWIRAEAAHGFAQLDAGECEAMTRESLLERLAKRRSSRKCA